MVPLTIAPGDDPDQADSHHHHGLEFEYDCDAPKCKIDVNVILPTGHPLTEDVDPRGFSRILVFQSVVDGGFGNFLKLEEGATLELGRFEQPLPPDEVVLENPPAEDQATSPAAATPRNGRQRKRFAAFPFRKRSGDRAASGPALAVVDADASGTAADSEKDKGIRDDTREGVRATIRLSALDEDGMDISTVNEQITYLHIVRLGAPPAADEEDVRPWVVKVIKREATVGVYPSIVVDCLIRSCRLARTRSIFTRFTVSPLNRLPPPILIPLPPQVRMRIPTRPPLPLPPLRLFTRMNLLRNVSSASLHLARLFSFRAVILLPARNVRSTWLNLVREAILSIMKNPTRTPAQTPLPERVEVAQQTQAV